MTDRPAASADAENEIVVTPEMIEAGLSHLHRYHQDRGVGDEETVRRIFMAMVLAGPEAS